MVYGSAAWLDAHQALCAELPEVADATVQAEFVVAGAPDGDARYQLGFVDGQLVSSQMGPAADGEADVSIAMSYKQALALLDGDGDANVAFMRGDLKPTGHTGKLLHLLALQSAEPYRRVLAALAGQTDR